MPRSIAASKVESFDFRIDPDLKVAFAAATAARHKPAGQVLRDFMRAYVGRQREQEAARQSRTVARLAAD